MLFKYVRQSLIQKRLTTSAGVFTDSLVCGGYDDVDEGIMGAVLQMQFFFSDNICCIP